MLPLAVVLGTGVANASPDDTALAPAIPSTTADWLSLTQHEPGHGPSPLPSLFALLGRSPVDLVPPLDSRRGDRAVGPANPLVADSWTRVETVDAPETPPAVDQQPIQAFCERVPVDPDRCTVTAVDAGVGAAIGAGIAAGVSAPVAIAAGMVGAAAGFVAGIPFMPTGLVVGPLLGAAVGVAVVAGPAALLGAALGASVGAIVGITTPLPQDGRTDGSGAATTSPR
ncbi:hypothetical protein OIE68_26220 [Nocardia vinacea]|uniref:Glycine zipper family protein n=1 Tax=Nocardia vinacea TaxID=96468 RepID=A0ABZ1Z076_9NOCA|nr:hypothetical protein OIE68_26220 [Nocardia vinacea]